MTALDARDELAIEAFAGAAAKNAPAIIALVASHRSETEPALQICFIVVVSPRRPKALTEKTRYRSTGRHRNVDLPRVNRPHYKKCQAPPASRFTRR
jgi:hypothetical protein